eukprot:CAMPEP_0178384752 /NCGR_PEP_ID=MMETSP0689_2-20121128/7677_1 /TAXON_ID=160604 /ORGANISM="Amphidinium massartii, Strain CS-259" /LENGTH=101 /DNA_ID=CAMNT_0020005009 /DNA_START=42 /DNA_END=347 /DNA_ORIENTATION=-
MGVPDCTVQGQECHPEKQAKQTAPASRRLLNQLAARSFSKDQTIVAHPRLHWPGLAPPFPTQESKLSRKQLFRFRMIYPCPSAELHPCGDTDQAQWYLFQK